MSSSCRWACAWLDILVTRANCLQVLRYQGRMAGLGVQLAGLGCYGVLVGVMVQCRQLLPSRKVADQLLDVLLSLSTAIFIAARWPQVCLDGGGSEDSAPVPCPTARLLDILRGRADKLLPSFCEQIIVGFRNRGVGQLNVYTTSLYLFGNLVRIYTTLTQVCLLPSPEGEVVTLVPAALLCFVVMVGHAQRLDNLAFGCGYSCKVTTSHWSSLAPRQSATCC